MHSILEFFQHGCHETAPDPAPLGRDILAASDGTANPAAIAQLLREGPAAVRECRRCAGLPEKPCLCLR